MIAVTDIRRLAGGVLAARITKRLGVCYQTSVLDRGFFMWITGWKSMAFPGPRSDWWVTTIAPTVGAIVGGYFYDFLIQPFLPKKEEAEESPAQASS